MVLDQDLQKLVNGLWLVGAEAISINGQRLTNLTAIREAGGAITVNFKSLGRPYTVSAIGNKNQMAARLLDTEGGRTWLALRTSFGLRFDVNSEDSMTLPAGTPARPCATPDSRSGSDDRRDRAAASACCSGWCSSPRCRSGSSPTSRSPSSPPSTPSSARCARSSTGSSTTRSSSSRSSPTC